MEIRVLAAADAETYYQLRLQALEQEPEAFGQSPEEHRSMPMEIFRERLGSGSTDANFVLGAFAEGELVGTAGFVRQQRVKESHKGLVWGVYLIPRWRAHGIGRDLLSELVRLARAQSGLEQIGLAVGAGQEVAKRLYTSLGFEIWGRERAALKIGDRYVDEDHMVLGLTEWRPLNRSSRPCASRSAPRSPQIVRAFHPRSAPDRQTPPL